MSAALDEAINIRKLDVVAVEIDDNASNKKKIESYKRVNGPDEYKEESVKDSMMYSTLRSVWENKQ